MAEEAGMIPPASNVTAAELVRNFSAIRQRSTSMPVFITNHGKPSHVLCSTDQFRALTKPGLEDGSGVALELAQLAAWIDQGLLLIDRHGYILHSNAALLALVPHDPARLVGRIIFDAMPEFCGTLAEGYLRRMILAREIGLFEMPSPFSPHGWLQCRLAPVGDRFVLLIRDISASMREVRATGVRDALARAMNHNGQVAIVSLSRHRTIEHAHRNLAALLGLPERQLEGLPFCDLVETADRAVVSEVLSDLCRQRDGATILTRLLTRAGELADVQIGASCGPGDRMDDCVTLVVCWQPVVPGGRERVPSLRAAG
jgi:PAS domain-containing protein